MSTFIITAIIIGLMVLAVRKAYKSRQKDGCGCGCKGCACKEACPSHKV